MTTPRAPYFHFDEKVNDKRRKGPIKEAAPAEDNLSEILTRPSSSSSAGSSTPTLKKLPLDKVLYEPLNNKHTPRRGNSGDGSAPLSSRHTPRRPQAADSLGSALKGSWKGNAARQSLDGFGSFHHDHASGDINRPAPPSEALWEYMDSKGDVHGPYPADKILLWYDSKRFPGFDDSLILRQQGNGCWSSMKAVTSQLRYQVQNSQPTPPPPAANAYITPTRVSGTQLATAAPRVRFAVEDAGNESDGEELSDLPPHIAQRLKAQGSQSDSFADLPPHLAARLHAKAFGQVSMDISQYHDEDHDGPPPGITTLRGTASNVPRAMCADLDMSAAPQHRRRTVPTRPAPQHQQGPRNMDYRMLSDRELTMVAQSLFLNEAGSKWYYMDPSNPRTSEPMNAQQMMDIITLRGLDPNFLIVGVSSAVTVPPSHAFYRPLGGLMHNSLRGEKYRLVTKADMMMDAPGLSWNLVRNVPDSTTAVDSQVQDNGFRHDRRRSTDESDNTPMRKERHTVDKQGSDSWVDSPTQSALSAGPATSDRSSAASYGPSGRASPSFNTTQGSTSKPAFQRSKPAGSPFASGSEATVSEPLELGVSLDMDDILDAHITGQLSASLAAVRTPSGLLRQSSSAGVEAMDSGAANPSPSMRIAQGRDLKAKLIMGGLQSWASQVSDELGRVTSLEASSSLTRENSLPAFKTESTFTSTSTTTVAAATDPMLQQPQTTPRTTPENPKPQPLAPPTDSPPVDLPSIERGISPMRSLSLGIPPTGPVSLGRFQSQSDAIATLDAPLLEPSNSPVKLPESCLNAQVIATGSSEDDASTSALGQERRVSSSGCQTTITINMQASTEPSASPPAEPMLGKPPSIPSLLRASVGALDCKSTSNARLGTLSDPALANKPVFKSLDLKELNKSRSVSSSGQNSPIRPSSNGSGASSGGISQAALARAAVASAMKSSQAPAAVPRPKEANGDSKSSGRVSGLAAFFMQQMQNKT